MAQEQRIRLYIDRMSQPSRACAIFCRANGIKAEEVQVLLHKGEQRGSDYTQRNPLGRVPLLEITDTQGQAFRLPESCAILSYLADVSQVRVPEHWLPRTDRKARAWVEAAMHWQHLTARGGAMRIVFNKVLAKRLGAQPNPAIAEEGIVLLKRALRDLNVAWLGEGRRPFMCGDSVCVADVLVCCELEQLSMLNKARDGVDMDSLLCDYPHIHQWMGRVAQATAPHYEEVHSVLRRAAAASGGCRSPAQGPESKL